jgi:hypothetical protein
MVDMINTNPLIVKLYYANAKSVFNMRAKDVPNVKKSSIVVKITRN